ncbi:acyl-ACP--UDP-N-acetylglucosamine O-acyltransferase family protein [Amycolatopsis azurea]|uniref:Acyl-[acyl-carrier-protein]--UDP-N-acetylglucosamine O-acyltransferase n=1 Tax=Amycolatopsis azurea DSM 43854 TaxID=1238180 RepID=M2PZL9_9PSEU|nr:acyl-ACP-UDP-N-acetylglucosamine O-acyltransferase [Amycolatopsis azurea]EMD30093.1 Acyl-[acyl-carrier-protein]--UDP-N-acetylglucosamine O-acyltransferase [Amycolatopsis azurea DSM 43854]OOC07216.1 UDP-N-acetylglucosamine acyltransferase [Amycolatopsis azurea DSM 43854]
MVNRIHPTAIIGEGVELGEDNVIGPFTVIVGPTRVGDGNWIGPHVTIGTPAEDRGREHPAAWETAPNGDPDHDGHGVVIGSRNRIREYVSVHQGTWRTTTVGDGGYFLRGSHIAHDCLVEDAVTVASNVITGGHCHIWSGANLGMGAILHQRVVIGPGAMVGMSSAVRKEVGAFTIAVGNPARVTGVNTVGLSRRGLDEATVEALGPWLKGKAGLPEDGLADRLPGDLSTLVKAWDARPRE